MSIRRFARWRRATAALAAVVLVLVGAVVVWAAERAASRAAVRAALRRETGFDIAAMESVAPVLWPAPGVVARNVVFSGQGPIRAGSFSSLAIHLDLPSLLFGRVRASAVSIRGGKLSIDADAAPAPEWRAAAAREARTLSRLRFFDVAFEASGAGEALKFGLVHAAELDWGDADGPATLSTDMTLGDADGRVAGKLYVHRPVDLWNGRVSAVLARASGPRGEAVAQGEYAEGVGFRGRLVASTQDLPGLRRRGWLDLPAPAGVTRAALRADVAWTHRGAAFTDAELTLGENRFEGSLNLRRDDGRPSASGTLAAEDLDLTAWAAASPTLLATSPGGAAHWRDEPIDWSAEMRGDVDLRVSARRARLGALDAENVALAVLMKRGRLELTLSEAAGYKGAARGRLSVSPTQDGLAVKAAARWRGVDLAALPRQFVRKRWTGLSSGQLDIDAMGRSPHEMAAAMDGRILASAAAGEIRGFDLEAAARRAARRPPIMVRAETTRTSFDEASLDLRVLRGSGQIEQLTLTGPGVAASGRGVVDLGALTVSARIVAATTRAGDAGPPTPFVMLMRGPLTAPTLRAE